MGVDACPYLRPAPAFGVLVEGRHQSSLSLCPGRWPVTGYWYSFVLHTPPLLLPLTQGHSPLTKEHFPKAAGFPIQSLPKPPISSRIDSTSPQHTTQGAGGAELCSPPPPPVSVSFPQPLPLSPPKLHTVIYTHSVHSSGDGLAVPQSFHRQPHRSP